MKFLLKKNKKKTSVIEMLPNLPLNCTKLVFFATTQKLSINVESQCFLKMPLMQNQEERQSGKSHGKIICEV